MLSSNFNAICVPWASLLHTEIRSAIAFCPTGTGMLGAGSYNQTSAIYREDNMKALIHLQVQFSKEGNFLYTGGWKVKETYVHIPYFYCKVLKWCWCLYPYGIIKNIQAQHCLYLIKLVFVCQICRYKVCTSFLFCTCIWQCLILENHPFRTLVYSAGIYTTLCTSMSFRLLLLFCFFFSWLSTIIIEAGIPFCFCVIIRLIIHAQLTLGGIKMKISLIH